MRRPKLPLAGKDLYSDVCMWTFQKIGAKDVIISHFLTQGFRFFSSLVGGSDPWSKKWRVIS